jgi:hypothetical protein
MRQLTRAFLIAGATCAFVACDDDRKTPTGLSDVESGPELGAEVATAGAALSRDASERLASVMEDGDSRAQLQSSLDALGRALESRDTRRIRSSLALTERALGRVPKTAASEADRAAIELAIASIRFTLDESVATTQRP